MHVYVYIYVRVCVCKLAHLDTRKMTGPEDVVPRADDTCR